MIGAYEDGKDLYALIASNVYHNNYEDNKEFYPDGTMNPEGKHRRTSVKSLLLGIMYGRGIASVAEQIKPHEGPTTREDIQEAQRITRSFFDNFPKVEKWINKTYQDARKNGYVEDLWGRRRRLPDINLPKYSIEYKGTEDFNPLLESSGRNTNSKLVEKYSNLLQAVAGKKDYDNIKSEAQKENVLIQDNQGFIAQAERQSVNARIQGGAASMSKRAMIAVYNDPLMKELGFKLVNVVHDEIIGEVSEENAERASKRLSELMIQSAKPECQVPMKCDVSCYKHWYEDVYSAEVKELFDNLTKEGKTEEEAKAYILSEHEELDSDMLEYLFSI